MDKLKPQAAVDAYFKRKEKRKGAGNLNLIDVKAKTEPQRQMIQSFIAGMNLVAVGSSGTGKTFIATYLALKDVLIEGNHDKIVFVRSAVATRDQGFLPGTLEEKSEVYALPFKKIVNDICDSGTAWEVLSKKKTIEFITTSYIRGLTLDNCILVLDETQNLDDDELISILTRVGDNTQLIISGDTRQNDLFRSREKSCYDKLMIIAGKMPDEIDVINFLPQDIVRSGFVKKLIMVLEE